VVLGERSDLLTVSPASKAFLYLESAGRCLHPSGTDWCLAVWVFFIGKRPHLEPSQIARVNPLVFTVFFFFQSFISSDYTSYSAQSLYHTFYIGYIYIHRKNIHEFWWVLSPVLPTAPDLFTHWGDPSGRSAALAWCDAWTCLETMGNVGEHDIFIIYIYIYIYINIP